jgi:septal ring factor EnvC (AmiA/AmiB activator)
MLACLVSYCALGLCAESLAADSLLRGTNTPGVEGDAGAVTPEHAPAGIGLRRRELHGLTDKIGASDEKRRKMEAEVDAIRNDRARLSAALVETTQKAAAGEQKMNDVEARLSELNGREDAIHRSLEGRRAILGEVLASLQRMGRKPPPALLVAPEDILRAIRTSMLLSAVLPEMRAEMEALAADLSDLAKVKAGIAAEKQALGQETAALADEHERLTQLIAARQDNLGVAEQALNAEREQTRELAQRASGLKDLIATMENESSAAAHAAQTAKAADDARRLAELEQPKQKPEVPFKDPARLTPAIAFADAKGMLPLPATGTPIKNFGAPDGLGGTEKGLLLGTRTQAVVASPSDGWIVYAGPYRSYGQLLIVNAGQGYYILLAGMERINVNVGQFVLAGEPVATMGDGSVKTAAAIAIGAAQPILYVEFRKDGTAIDPGPWWAKPDIQRVRG